MSKRILRFVGAALAIAGIVILVYAIYAYLSQRQLEAALTAQIPGQNLNPGGATSTPIALVPLSANPGLPTSVPTLDTTRVSPSITPIPTHATPVQPGSTGAAIVIGTATAVSLAPGSSTATAASNPPAGPSLAPTVINQPTRVLGSPRGKGSPAARLVIPKLNMDLAVIPAKFVTYQQSGSLYNDWEVPFDAAGHLNTTPQPGEIGNAVLSGHHNLTAPGQFGLGVFAGLWNLAVGDEIRVGTEDGKTQYWRVQESFPIKEAGEPLEVRVQHAQQVMGDTPVPTLTLLTCWDGQTNPLAGNTYRWVVHAELVNIN